MPRSRGSEMPQRQSPRGPLHLRTSSSDSDPLQRRSITDKSSKPGDRRSPRVTRSDSGNQKKLGTRIADLESQLGQAQEELKLLKNQLASAKVGRKEAQEKLQKKTPKPILPHCMEIPDKQLRQTKIQESNKKIANAPYEIHNDNQRETDVFEVRVEKVEVEPTAEFDQPIQQEDSESKLVSLSAESPSSEPEIMSFNELALKNDEINSLKAKLEEKEKDVEAFCEENEKLKTQLNEAALEISSAQAKEEDLTSRLSQLGQELKGSKATEVQLNEKLEMVEVAKEALETEMKKMRVQTEQWRKAADAAAMVLAGGVEMNGEGRISERCGSMDKPFSSMFEAPVGGYTGFVSSPGLAEESDDGFGSGKRKGSGIRMFGDLWKKKGHK